ncbi:MAG: hypothetical protein AAGJ70_07120, partial [Pseudomonadota bacterium]
QSSLDRRTFVAGLGAASLGVLALPEIAHAGLSAQMQQDRAGLISIAGRITNSLGAPEKRAYVEVMQHRVKSWTPGSSSAVIDVQEWEGPEWLGVWTDDDGVFGIHTWWAVDGRANAELATAPQQAEVRFNIETQDGRRLLRSMWLDANPSFAARQADDPAMLTPVSWDRRTETAQFIANFSVG